MPRKTPPGRVQDIARAACELFIEKGYRRTLMTDVAARLEINHALLYRYVESKEALLELAVRYAMGQAADLNAMVPLDTPAPGDVLDLVRNWFALHATFPALGDAVRQGPGSDAAAELAAIIDELYSFIEQNRLLLLLIESMVIDHPELSELYVSKSKSSHIGRLSAFLRSRASAGVLRPLSDPDVGAHFLAESVAWFAQHRKSDPGLARIDDERARASVRELLLSAFVPDTPPR
ncbi:MAG: TetR/AcrR family transcriptional regulator [Trebonia sp.]